MQRKRKAPRPYGSGTLYQKSGSWYGRWLVGERRMNRRLGPNRQPGAREGLTRSQAEGELRRRMEQEHAIAASATGLSVEEAGKRYLRHLEHVLERKPSTVQDYRIMLERHMVPFFAARQLDRIEPDNVAAYMAAKRRKGLATKTVINHLNFLHGGSRSRSNAGGSQATRSRLSTGHGSRAPTRISASSNWRRSRRCCAPCPTTCSARSSACCT